MNTLMRQEREQKGWTQKYVAQQIGVTKAAVHDMETGRRYPSFKVLVKLLDLFGYNDPAPAVRTSRRNLKSLRKIIALSMTKSQRFIER